MTPKKDWFDTCPIIGIGTVRIKIFDGVVGVISNVKHVLDIRKNLISLGVLDNLGYSYSSKGRIMKITKGALIVMKGKKVSMLYGLIGNTVIGRVVVTTTVESNTDDTKLWHI